ncbi:hypothetical protein HMPREF9193_01454 [Treponema lecithinolyticum ATCC 700332]|uniref:Uncharacterized protein n=1 Tax=Treponema lecithinolyticum ATCC 700332 TaxID=1321815 RepID=A0ABN0NXQ8_TRELE|nr:hypothetical protein HMPREF9193_01454 [Treponema lecithinolyticum ATCC 700332]
MNSFYILLQRGVIGVIIKHTLAANQFIPYTFSDDFIADYI